ncbi:hypothetical protein J2S74_000724 [Evansella vedderi]|uniref:Type I restriction enzyme R protein N-terminal domain-containing protein n=1 Tax=Evansella vedderi TaxID=38282 RepID=A0ABT9ZQ37_9BACI|nr:hypothetical protein [Evansella vedderi]MDQ0253352.1 hypothetical protein [Evansella vedderi]
MNWIPYIFAEIKRFDTGIEDATAQLISYMEADPSVRLGIVTDGLEVKCIDRQGEVLNDLPKCRPQFLPETKDKRLYMNLKNGKKYIYATELDDSENVEIYDSETGLFVEYDLKSSIPLIGNGVAVVPITADE